MDELTYYDIVKKLVGKVYPVGSSEVDARRFENLEQTTELVDKLVDDLVDVVRTTDNGEHSIVKAKEYSKNFLKNLAESILDQVTGE